MNITKILFSVIAAIMIVTNTNATTMCVTDDMQQVILDPSIVGTSYSQSATTNTWTTTFSYGTIEGIETCNNIVPANTSVGHPEYNGIFDQNYIESTGNYCWCRMTSPVRSAWAFFGSIEDDSGCEAGCAYRCGHNVQDHEYYRYILFTSAGM